MDAVGSAERHPGAVAEIGAAALQEICDTALHGAGFPVPAAQLHALLVTEVYRGLSIGVLARSLHTSPSAVSRLCDRLQDAGLIVRTSGAGDRRAVMITLSSSGRALLAGVHRERRARLARSLDRMSPAGRAALLRGLAELATITG